jgi:hypothetical protein
VTLIIQSEPKSPLDIMQNGSYFVLDQRLLYEKYELKFKEEKVERMLYLQQIEENLFNHIVWAPRI